MGVKIYVEGGGERKDTIARCQRAFIQLLHNMGFEGRMPRIVVCGPRGSAYARFCDAERNRGKGDFNLLFVDSEDPVKSKNTAPDSPIAWNHLRKRDFWKKPRGTQNDQAALMVTCMEAWIAADRNALAAVFPGLKRKVLPDMTKLEAQKREALFAQLTKATSGCPGGGYHKGTTAFLALGKLDPNVLEELAHFRRFREILKRHLK